MKLYVVARNKHGLVEIKVFAEEDRSAADVAEELFIWTGLSVAVFIGRSLADVIATHPEWFGEGAPA